MISVVADIGGTNARFAWIDAGSNLLQGVDRLACANFPDLQSALHSYLEHKRLDIAAIGSICLAVAGPIERDAIKLTNNHWFFSKSGISEQLGATVKVINDFTAQLLSVFTLAATEVRWLGGARPDHNQVIAVLGPGTGLGVAGHTPRGDIIPSEGGHLAFAPVDEHEVAILRYLWQVHPRVSVERLLSGPGLVALYRANAALNEAPLGNVDAIGPEWITARAHEGDPLCLQAVRDFAAILGSLAGDIAIGFGARGGVYLTGGVLAHIEGLYPEDLLRERFNAKGRFTEYCDEIALGLIRAEHTGLRGCAFALNNDY